MGPACNTAPTAVLALCSLLGLWFGLALLPGLFCWALLLAVQLVLRLCLGPAGAMPGLCQGYARAMLQGHPSLRERQQSSMAIEIIVAIRKKTKVAVRHHHPGLSPERD